MGATGGASTVQLAVANLPSHTHSASQSAHTHSQPTHTHTAQVGGTYVNWDANNVQVASKFGTAYYRNWDSGPSYSTATTASSGGDTTGSATPSISIGRTGSGTAFSILPPYLVVNMWKRLS